MKDLNPTTLYHYTTMSTLHAILSNIEHKPDEGASLDDISFYNIKLRATHYKYLNDPTEYKFFVECVSEGLRRYESLNSHDCNISKTYKSITHLTQSLVGEACIISLSEHNNDLPMWRSYGGDGSGVAIGFNREKLKSGLKTQSLKKCSYESREAVINSLLRSGFIENTYKSMNVNDKGGYGINLLADEATNAPFSKNECYSSEKEWRMVVYSNNTYEFTVRNGLIIPYTEIAIPVDCIDEIIIGPCADKELSKYSLQLMLTKKLRSDFSEKIIVKTSDIPYIGTK